MPKVPEPLEPRRAPDVLKDILALLNRSCGCCEPERLAPATGVACEPAEDDQV